MRKSYAVLIFIALLFAAGSAVAQGQQPPPTYEQALTRNWKDVHNRILEIAKDFPESKFNSRPQKDARSFVDELRHVTLGLEMTTAILKGEKYDWDAHEKEALAKPKTRESVVHDMEAAIAASYAQLDQGASPRLIGWLEHQGEHYGKLVTIYRINGLVPPSTRAEQAERAKQEAAAKAAKKK